MNIQLVDNWKSAWKMFSMYFFLILGLLPELFNLAVSSGLLQTEQAPALLSKIVMIVAFLGAASRLIKQRAVESGISSS